MAQTTLKATLKDSWWVLPDNRPFVPAACAWELVQQCHEATHLGKSSLAALILKNVYLERVHQLTAIASARCITCAKNNARQGPLPVPGVNKTGDSPFEVLVTDFTEMPKCGRYRYILLFICTYTNWVEVFPTRSEKAEEVAKGLLKEIIPRFGLPLIISSDNGPSYVHHVIQLLAKNLHVSWRLHCNYRPESSSKAERANRFLKNCLAKLCQETGLPWVELLPLALFRLRCTPHKTLKLSPFELLYGRPPPLVRPTGGSIKELGQLHLSKTVQALGKVIQDMQQYVQEQRPLPLTRVHPYAPGQSVWLKSWKQQDLQPKWTGPHVVLLSSPLAVKLEGIKPWIHHTRVKPAYENWTITQNSDNPLQVTIRKTARNPSSQNQQPPTQGEEGDPVQNQPDPEPPAATDSQPLAPPGDQEQQ